MLFWKYFEVALQNYLGSATFATLLLCMTTKQNIECWVVVQRVCLIQLWSFASCVNFSDVVHCCSCLQPRV